MTVIDTTVPPDVGLPDSAPIRGNFVTIDGYLVMLQPVKDNLATTAGYVLRVNSGGTALEAVQSPTVTVSTPVISIAGDTTLALSDAVPAQGTDEVRAPLHVVRHGSDTTQPITITIPASAGHQAAHLWNILVHPDQTGTVTVSAGGGTVNGLSSVTLDPSLSVGTISQIIAFENSGGTAPKCLCTGSSTGETLTGPLTVTGPITAQAGLDLVRQIIDQPLRRVKTVSAGRAIGSTGYEDDIGAVLRCTAAVTLTVDTSNFPDGGSVFVVNDSSGTVTIDGPGATDLTLAAPSSGTYEVGIVTRVASTFLAQTSSFTSLS